MAKQSTNKKTVTEQAVSAPSGAETEIGLVSRSEYDAFKRRALRFEALNKKFILAIPCAGEQDWCEMGDNSALIYKYLVCEKLGAHISINDDFDSYYNQFEIGRVRSRGYEMIRSRVKRAGLYKGEQIKDRCLMIELTKPVAEKVLKHLRTVELEYQEGLNEIIPTRPIDPVLYQKMLEVATRLHRLALRQLDRLSSETNGIRMIETMDMMIANYHTFSNNIRGMSNKEILEEWSAMRDQAQSIIVELQIVASLKLWKRDICLSVGQGLVDIKQRLELRIARLETKVDKKTKKKEENAKDDSKEAKSTEEEVRSVVEALDGKQDYGEDDAAAKTGSNRRKSGSRASKDKGVEEVAAGQASESV